MYENSRIRPYLDTNIVVLIERLREIHGISIGKILTILLQESKTFNKLIENYYADDEILKKIFLGLPFENEICDNSQHKEQKCKEI